MNKSKGFDPAANQAGSALTISGLVLSPQAVLIDASKAWIMAEALLAMLALPFQPKSNLLK
jgi:hypothetical protein